MNAAKPKLNCAIYTRKSHEEGLQQEYNSLDAQYDSASHYIEYARDRRQGRSIFARCVEVGKKPEGVGRHVVPPDDG